jgi:hypothetical protein
VEVAHGAALPARLPVVHAQGAAAEGGVKSSDEIADEFFGAASPPPAPDDEAPKNPAIAKAREDMALLSVGRTEKKLGGESLDDLMAEPDEPVDWLARGLLTRGAVGLIAAEAKGTKTWVGTELMIALSSGTPAFGRFEIPRRMWSLGCFLEDGRRNLKSRARAIKAGRGAGGCDTSRIRFEARPKINLCSADDCAWIIASARAVQDAAGEDLGLIYIDPLRNAHTAEENSATEMQPVMDALARIRDVTKANLLVPHHMGRPSKEKAGQRLAHRIRGSTAIFGSVDAAILIETKKYTRTNTSANWKNLIDVELRDLTPTPPFGLELDVQVSDGSAHIAGWSHYEDPKAMTETAEEGETAEEQVMRILTAELAGDRNMGRAPRSWSAQYVAEQTDFSRATAQRHMEKLTKEGRLLRIGRQWRAVDDIDEDRDDDV